jgi:hypothetical protein
MKLALISMIRDDVDILPAFLQHASELFHMGFLLDQRSSDGSQQIMAEFCGDSPGWSYFKLDFPGRHQREMSNLFMRRAFEAGADAVVFLDADEFIDCTKGELYSRTRCLNEEHKIGLLRWIPCVPKIFSNKEFDLDEPLYVAPHPSLSLVPPKVLVTRQIFLLTNGMLRVTPGNHAVEGGQSPLPTQDIGGIYHVPIRSKQQLFRKAVLGAISNLARGNLMGVEGFQKKDMVEMIGAGRLTAARLRCMAAHYTEKRGEVGSINSTDLVAAGFQLKKLNVARSRRHIPRPKSVNDYVVVANSLRDTQIEIPDETTFTFSENVVRLNTRCVPFADVPEMRSALERLRTELAAVAAERERVESDRERLQSDLVALTTDREHLQSDLAALTADREHLQAELGARMVERARVESDLEDLRAEVHSLLASRSWRVTGPLRAASRMASRAASRFGRASLPRVVAPSRDSRAS